MHWHTRNKWNLKTAQLALKFILFGTAPFKRNLNETFSAKDTRNLISQWRQSVRNRYPRSHVCLDCLHRRPPFLFSLNFHQFKWSPLLLSQISSHRCPPLVNLLFSLNFHQFTWALLSLSQISRNRCPLFCQLVVFTQVSLVQMVHTVTFTN